MPCRWFRKRPPPWVADLDVQLSRILRNQERIMIDTARILAEVAKQRSEVASLLALVNAQNATIKDQAAALAAAIAANDPVAIAKVQADLDQAATDLAADNADVETALAANVPA
jgi:hypothetical protein